MEKKDIENRISRLMLNKFEFHVENLINEDKRKSLLNPQIGFQAIDMIVLFMELEKEFGIMFTEEDVINYRFDVYDSIVGIIEEKVKAYKN